MLMKVHFTRAMRDLTFDMRSKKGMVVYFVGYPVLYPLNAYHVKRMGYVTRDKAAAEI